MASRRILSFGRTTLVNTFRRQYHRSSRNETNKKIRPSTYKKAHEGRVLGMGGSFGEGCDFEHWQIWPRPLTAYPSKDEVIRYYIYILSLALGCKEQAIQKIYSVATREYYAFGANVDEKTADKLDDLQDVCYVVPDQYRNPLEKRYQWDPFVNGQPLPYDPKYYGPNAVPLSLADEVLDWTCQPGKRRNLDEISVLNDIDLKKPRRYKGFEGADFEHWEIYTEPLSGDPSKDEIIHYYVKILSQVLGSEEEAVKKIYSVSTRYNCYVFGANISMELADMMMDLPLVCATLPDSYVDRKEKRYSWEPFINGQTLPYDPKYYPKRLRKRGTT